MFEKVNPSHPDKIADRIAGALVDKAYTIEDNPKIAIEVLIGHGVCLILIESNISYKSLDEYVTETGEYIRSGFVRDTVYRIIGTDDIDLKTICVPQDGYLAENQVNDLHCGDNGIFRGVKNTPEQNELTRIAGFLYEDCPYDGKYLIDNYADKLIICQSHATNEWVENELENHNVSFGNLIINPLGDWTGGIDVDSGATNRKLGSDMGDGVTGGGIHGKDLSKTDVSVNIFAWLLVNDPDYVNARGTFPGKHYGDKCEFECAIGDTNIGGYPFDFIVSVARDYINDIGGFEKLAEWGLIRPAMSAMEM
jgi:S-adenosylmethionine synthetase